jgi:hypothetical protein
MTYDPTIPNADDAPASQQAQIKTNYSTIASIFSSTSGGVVYNHSPFNTANEGKHEAIILEDQVSDPDVTNDYVSLYNKDGDIFFRLLQFLPNEIPNDPMQLTYTQVNTAGPQYQTFIVGGYILYIGSVSGSTSSSANITTTITLNPVPSQILCPIASSNSLTTTSRVQGLGVATQILSNSQFNIILSSPWVSGGAKAYSLTWICIGSK